MEHSVVLHIPTTELHYIDEEHDLVLEVPEDNFINAVVKAVDSITFKRELGHLVLYQMHHSQTTGLYCGTIPFVSFNLDKLNSESEVLQIVSHEIGHHIYHSLDEPQKNLVDSHACYEIFPEILLKMVTGRPIFENREKVVLPILEDWVDVPNMNIV